MATDKQTSLQQALFTCRDELAAAGLIYPFKWRWPSGTRPLEWRWPSGTHHSLGGLLRDSKKYDHAFDEFTKCITAHAEKNVLLSAEVLSLWTQSTERREALLRFFTAAQEVTPVSLVWTLRRADDLLNSLSHLRLAITGNLPTDLTGDFLSPGRVEGSFAGMQLAEEAVGGRADYLKYESSGAHNERLLSMLGLPDGTRELVRRQLHSSPRSNVSMGHKAVIVMTHPEFFASRAGVPLPLPVLRQELGSGRFRFADDLPCELIGCDAGRAAHERFLVSARSCDFAPYPEFFAEEQVERSPPADLDPSVVSNDDLSSLVAYLRDRGRL